MPIVCASLPPETMMADLPLSHTNYCLGGVIIVLGFFFILIDGPNDLFPIDTSILNALRKQI